MKKNISTLLVGFFLSILIISCNGESIKDMTNTSGNVKESDREMKEEIIASNDTTKGTSLANWQAFKKESDLAIVSMEKDIKTIEIKLDKANKSAKTKLKADLNRTKQRLEVLKEKLKKRNDEFENDANKFDEKVVLKSQSFQREFKHDMKEMGNAFKNLFKDNTR